MHRISGGKGGARVGKESTGRAGKGPCWLFQARSAGCLALPGGRFQVATWAMPGAAPGWPCGESAVCTAARAAQVTLNLIMSTRPDPVPPRATLLACSETAWLQGPPPAAAPRGGRCPRSAGPRTPRGHGAAAVPPWWRARMPAAQVCVRGTKAGLDCSPWLCQEASPLAASAARGGAPATAAACWCLCASCTTCLLHNSACDHGWCGEAGGLDWKRRQCGFPGRLPTCTVLKIPIL